MAIRNIVSKDNINITNCEHEPIHIPGSIQPFGFLLGLTGTDHLIRYCSENCEGLFGAGPSGILGQPISWFLPQADLDAFWQYFRMKSSEHVRPFVFVIQNRSYHATAYEAGEVLVLELEQLIEEKIELPDIYLHTKRFSYHTQRADNMQRLCQDIAEETRKLTGFDRVMVYRFDKDHNGEVFAECRQEGLEPFLHLHYPSSDIPAQARELYLRNQVRLIADVNYTPSPLWAWDADGTTAKQLDLSLSFLRSVSPMHVQYLKNMGVAASFSVSIIYHGKLWGLLACHHYSGPKHIPYYTRLAAHLQGIFLSSQIDVRLVADEFEIVKKTETKLDDIREQMARHGSSVENENTLGLLKDLINADGFFICYKNRLHKSGTLPSDEQIHSLYHWLQNKSGTGFKTSYLAKEYEGAKAISNSIAGVLYLSLGRTSGNGVVWTRGEVEKTVSWGGNPNKAVQVNAETNVLTPRNSFEIWKETVQFQSLEWKKAETNAASVICSAIQHHLHLADLMEEEQRYRSLNARLQKANDELANMSWISTHDLKEPLRKIQFYASIVLENNADQIPDSVRMNVTRMQNSAAKMQLLIEDLLSYTRIVNEEKRFVNIDLNAALEEVQSELSEAIEEKEAKLQWSQLPVIKGIPFQIRQLFINLLSNSLKFTVEGRKPLITISSEAVRGKFSETSDTAEDYFCIKVTDNGVGFPTAYSADLFKIFQRLHGQQFKGSGIGLAICKKIAEAHNGIITAESVEGEGAVFSIYLPKLAETDPLKTFDQVSRSL